MWLVGGVMVVLAAATGAAQILSRRSDTALDTAAIEIFKRRLEAWWLMCAVLAASFLVSRVATVVLFGLISFWALREFITLTPTRAADHRALFWVFFLITPLQYVLISFDQYGLYSVLIPVYAFLAIPARIAFAGDYKRFLERTAKIQAGLMVCVYCLSYAPALLYLNIPGYNGVNAHARLLFFFVIVVQMGDLVEFLWQKTFGGHAIAPAINPGKTWEGFLASLICASILGTLLWWATPFTPWVAGLMSLVITAAGLCGGLTMSAIKRDRGVADYGTLVAGHGGVLDRLDSICFAAPIFFHITRYYFT